MAKNLNLFLEGLKLASRNTSSLQPHEACRLYLHGFESTRPGRRLTQPSQQSLWIWFWDLYCLRQNPQIRLPKQQLKLGVSGKAPDSAHGHRKRQEKQKSKKESTPKLARTLQSLSPISVWACFLSVLACSCSEGRTTPRNLALFSSQDSALYSCSLCCCFS